MLVRRVEEGRDEDVIALEGVRRVDDVYVVAAQRRVEGVDERPAIVKVFKKGRALRLENGRRGTVQRDLRLHAGIDEELAAAFKLFRRLYDLLRHPVRPARRVVERAVCDLMSVGMGAEEPVLDHLAALGNGQPGIGVAGALGTVTELGKGAAVPADLRLRHPEGLILDGAQEVIGESGTRQLGGGLVVVVLHNVQLLVRVVIGQKPRRHHVRSDGRVRTTVQDVRLLVDIGDDVFVVEAYPLRHQRGMLPSAVHGRDDLLEGPVSKRPARHPPRLVERPDRAVLLLQIGVEARAAVGAITALAVGEDLVIDLPADDGGMAPERLAELLRDDAVFLAHDGRGLAGMAAGKDLRLLLAAVDDARLGVFVKQPPGRRAARRTHDDVDPRRIQFVDDVLEPAECKDALLRLHIRPCELAHAHTVDARPLHPLDIFVHLRRFPYFGVVRRSDIDLLHRYLSLPPPRYFSHDIIPDAEENVNTRREKKRAPAAMPRARACRSPLHTKTAALPRYGVNIYRR